MHTRLKEIRKALKLTQKQVAENLGLGQSTYAMIESGKRELLERHIRTISAIYNINDNWLRTGEGDMFINPYDSFLNELSAKYDIDNTLKCIVKSYLQLSNEQKKAVSFFLNNMSKQ